MAPTDDDSADPSAALRADPPRRQRADAQRNVVALLEAAKSVFARTGVDAPAKEITDLAGVGVGTLYRHFPRRSDLIGAVLEHEIDACASAATALSSGHEPWQAFTTWIGRYTELVGTKQGLAAALHSANPSLGNLADQVRRRLEPALEALLEAARSAGAMRSDVSAKDVIFAVALLCQPAPGAGLDYNHRMIAVFLDGLRAGTDTSQARR